MLVSPYFAQAAEGAMAMVTRSLSGTVLSTQSHPKPASPCNKQHPASCLNEKGGCKFNHACDAYVSDQGPKGRCGSVKHGRHNCDNPAKVSKEQQ